MKRKTINIYQAVMMSKDKKDFAFSADPLESHYWNENLQYDLKEKYQKLANSYKTAFLLEVSLNNGKLEYFEKIKFFQIKT